MDETLLTTREVAEKYRLSSKTIRSWTRAGRLPCVELGSRTMRYRPSDVEQALTGQPSADTDKTA